ncbi:MAG: peptide-methionine (S)-S-oxide reductase MsrA [Chloroflexi bacterium]|nr:peptide-methionine (S)-S-oxide reductase MsrA [Chloroflexota bacterium]
MPYGDTSLLIEPEEFPDPILDIPAAPNGDEQAAVLAGGCFWCTEGVFVELDGVLSVTSGYAGGTAETADYETVCSGRTNHAEVVRIRFDPARITYGQILKLFLSVAHDPTQLNHQGADVGRQYRSAIFYTDEAQRRVAQAYLAQLEQAHIFTGPIVTEVVPLEGFYPAEAYHQSFVARNPRQPYVAAVAMPKIRKLRAHFADRLKKS